VSGRDERPVFYKRPLCPHCGSVSDIIIKYDAHHIAGWLLSKQESREVKVSVILGEYYDNTLTPQEAKCYMCGTMGLRITIMSIRFFKKCIRDGNYMTWSEFKEARQF
jgi:hypothetical protein